jgi:phosphatidylserine decarboxylase
MTVRSQLLRLLGQEDINFLLTNRIPRRLATQFIGWFSRIEQPLIRDLSIGMWRLFSDLDLREAKTTQFRSMHDCFTRELKDGARPIDMDSDILVSPCDAIVGASGVVDDGRLLQVKGLDYALDNLLGDNQHASEFRDGCFVTLRLTSSMYHRFHAPHDCHVSCVSHFPGDTWNVNPATLKRIPNGCSVRTSAPWCRTTLAATGQRGDAGAGRRHPGRGHPSPLPRRPAPIRSDLPRPNVMPCDALVPRRRRGNRMVRARLDNHPARAEWIRAPR